MINAKTKLTGLIGWPVEHSLSPFIHNKAFEYQNLDYLYMAMPVKPGYLRQGIDGLKALGFVGANVTIPHKQEVLQYVDYLAEDARLMRAVNTLILRDGHLTGDNTDVGGFIRSLAGHNVPISGKKAVLLGAGGAAAAVVYGLCKAGIREIIVGGRNEAKVAEWCQEFAGSQSLHSYNWENKAFSDHVGDCDLLINCTPLGMYPHITACPPVAWAQVKPGTVAYDLVYNPVKTAFLQAAEKRGCQVINGLSMLIEQAMLSYCLWTGEEGPIAYIYQEVKSYVKKIK